MTVPSDASEARPEWAPWQRVLFRVAAVYFVLEIVPWELLPPAGWLVEAANAHLFHVRPTLVRPNGSGDTSFRWAQFYLTLLITAAAAAVWTLAGRRRRAYPRLLYWLRTLVRYWIAAAALAYGASKLFLTQMPFPSPSQLATPLGDFLPMRLSWMFFGYSPLYQFFAGAVEFAAGLLLLKRSTVTLGLIVAAGTFANVALVNLSYDVPVKVFALHLLLGCVFLLALDARRLWTFLVLNRAAPGTAAYEPPPGPPWQRRARLVLKTAMILLAGVAPLAGTGYMRYARAGREARDARARPLRPGVYDVRRFARNGDTLPALVGDTLRWRDLIVDGSARSAEGDLVGSVGTRDTLFSGSYGRGYFRYAADTARRTLTVWRWFGGGKAPILTVRYEMLDTNTVRLWTRLRGDSVYAELARSDRRFPLAERQFHWLSERNR